MDKLKKGDSVMLQHDGPDGGVLLECVVIKVKNQCMTLQIQLAFSDAPLIFRVHESELKLFES